MMRACVFAAASLGLVLGSTAYSGGAVCTDSIGAPLHRAEKVVNSLRPDKPSQMRVFAADGSEFTAAQAQWMKAQLSSAARKCADGNSAEAARRLAGVQALLTEHGSPVVRN